MKQIYKIAYDPFGPTETNNIGNLIIYAYNNKQSLFEPLSEIINMPK